MRCRRPHRVRRAIEYGDRVSSRCRRVSSVRGTVRAAAPALEFRWNRGSTCPVRFNLEVKKLFHTSRLCWQVPSRGLTEDFTSNPQSFQTRPVFPCAGIQSVSGCVGPSTNCSFDMLLVSLALLTEFSSCWALVQLECAARLLPGYSFGLCRLQTRNPPLYLAENNGRSTFSLLPGLISYKKGLCVVQMASQRVPSINTLKSPVSATE